MTTKWNELDARWLAYLQGLDEYTLNQLTTKISTSSSAGRRHRTTCLDIVLHVCTHAQYTTAQLVNMLRQLGQQPLPDVMLITLARQEAADEGAPA